MLNLPAKFMKTIREVHNEAGEDWLRGFHELIHECEERWQLEVLPPFDLSSNFVAPAIRKDGLEVVIKLSVPSDEFLNEIDALTLFNGDGIVKIIEVDREKGVLILEQLKPGSTLASIEDHEEAAFIASKIMKKLWIPAPKSVHIPYCKEREKSLNKINADHPEGLGSITKEILQEAAGIMKDIIENQDQPFLLHGD